MPDFNIIHNLLQI